MYWIELGEHGMGGLPVEVEGRVSKAECAKIQTAVVELLKKGILKCNDDNTKRLRELSIFDLYICYDLDDSGKPYNFKIVYCNWIDPNRREVRGTLYCDTFEVITV
ncbi:hypothetical protein CcNV_011 [Crangon crangon nudivirus]|uniref:Uncharacterized protein n=1 Tax=Crangon crangon nudivirus TaxID=2880838 RepID=A0AAE8Y4S2_9VIRU|nr:hypothetical protein QKT25_gp011 [Crangon crangon nudivirus]UBZ25495.1 hypothetical protein CcNV_011 [Crangon crangon nudivirus]